MVVACVTTGIAICSDLRLAECQWYIVRALAESFNKYLSIITQKAVNIPYLSLQQVNRPYLEEMERAVADVMASGWFLKGEATRLFETDYAQYIGTRHCVACGNGLDALTLIFRAYKEMGAMKEGDEVIVPANTYIASILSITENQLTPVLVEPRMDTLQIDDTLIEQAITPRTRAILLVHLYGRCAYSSTIERLCEKHHLKLVEDNAQAHGCRYEEDPLLMEAIFEINQYLFGQRKTFDFPIDPMGNEQEVKLYQYIKQTVPYGKLTNYEKLSEELGIPVDDIVEMLETNSCPIVVPCHRVIRASRRLGPYVTDPEIKNRLIHLEHDHLHDPSLR